MKKKLMAGFLMLSLFSCSIPAMADDNPKVLYYYVSQNAEAGGDGSIEKPFSSLTQARNAMRLVKNKDDYDDVRIIIRGGKYEISDTISFTSEDSGGEKTPLVVSNYPGEEVIFSGGKDVDMSKALPVTDEKVRERIPFEAQDKVLQVDLAEQGLTGLGIVNQTYYAVYNTGTQTSLLWDGETVNRARWPNDDYAKTGAILYSPPAWYSDNGYRTPPPGDPGVIFKVDAPRVSMWKDAPYAYLFGYYGNDWSTYGLKIKDIQSNIIFTTSSPGFGISKGRPYYIFNLIEEIDAPGEWYIDRDKEILYIYPKTEITENTNVCFTVLETNMIKMSYAKNVRVEGIIFENSKAAAIGIDNCENCEVAGCIIRNMAESAGSAIGKNCGFRSCDIYNIGSTALSINGGNTTTLEPGGCYVVNCHIYDWAKVKRVYNGAIAVNGVGQYAAYNKLHYAPHYAIALSGSNCILEYNEIFDVVRETADSGSIYDGKKWYAPGSIIRYNYFHDIYNTMGGGFTAVGMYCDDMLGDRTVWGNLFVNVDNPVLVGGGPNNHVENNIIVDAPPGAKQSIDYDSRGSEARWETSILEMYLKVHQYPWDSEAWQKQFPDLYNLLSTEADMRFPHNSTVKNNVIVNHLPLNIHENVYKYGEVGTNLETDEDVGFVDMENGNYKLRDDSIIYQALPDFKKIDPENSGIYADEYRRGSDLELVF